MNENTQSTSIWTLCWVVGIAIVVAVLAYIWRGNDDDKNRLADRLYGDGVKLGQLEQATSDLRLTAARLIEGQNATDKATSRLIADYGCLRSNLNDLGSFQVKPSCCDTGF